MQDLKEFKNYEESFHVLNPIMQSMVLVVQDVMNDRKDIALASRCLSSEQHNPNSFFSKLPSEALVNISSYVGRTNSVSVKDADDTAYEAFGFK